MRLGNVFVEVLEAFSRVDWGRVGWDHGQQVMMLEFRLGADTIGYGFRVVWYIDYQFMLFRTLVKLHLPRVVSCNP